MNKKLLISYTIFASLVFAFSIFFFSSNLYKEYKYADQLSSQTYYEFGLKIYDSAQKDLQSIIKEANNFYNNSNDFQAIKISINNKTLVTIPNSDSINSSSKFLKPFTTKMETPSGVITIQTNIYLLNPASIGYYARLSFLIVLIITLITIILIIFLNTKESKESFSENDELDLEDTLYTDSSSSSSYENSFELMSIQEQNSNNTEKEEIIDAISDNTSTIQEEESNNKENTEHSDNSCDDTIENKLIELPSEEIKPVELEKTPTGLFNPESGIGWETYLTTRLESELSRAIASEFDLSLFVFQLPQIKRNSDTFHNICNYLSIQFQFKDLLFEFESDCLVAIRNSMTLDEALTFSDKLYADIKNMIEDKDCYIGISSRSIRMVSGERLLIEAKESLKYAKEDKSSPIVAFRVDSVKYQKFMERNQ